MKPLPPPRTVESPQSDFVKNHLPARRRRDGIALVEGERSVAEALRGAWPSRGLLVESNFYGEGRAAEYLALAHQRGVPVTILNPRAFARISDCESPPPVSLLVSPPLELITAADALPGPRLLVLDRLADPGNAGTLVRSAVAFGFSVLMTDGGVRLDNEKFLRACAGTCFHSGALYRGGGAEDLAAWLAARAATVLVLDPHAGESLEAAAATLSGPAALVLGEEAAGVDWSVWSSARRVRIPMAAAVESLNVAVTGAIALYELARRDARP